MVLITADLQQWTGLDGNSEPRMIVGVPSVGNTVGLTTLPRTCSGAVGKKHHLPPRTSLSITGIEHHVGGLFAFGWY